MRSNLGWEPTDLNGKGLASAMAVLCFALAARTSLRGQDVDCPAVHSDAVELGPLVGFDGTVAFQHAHAVGPPCPGASAFADPAVGTYALASGGADIWQNGDQFLFAYNVLAGDFSARVRVAGTDFVPGSAWGKFGLMARQDCGPFSRYSMVDDSGEDPQYSVRFTYRANLGPGTDGPGDDRDVVPAGPPKHADILRLDRTGSVLTGYVLDTTGAFGGTPGTWRKLGEHDWGDDLPPAVLVGIFANSHTGCEPATITFADYQTLPPPVAFRRGDADGDGQVTLGDAAFIASRLAVGTIADLDCAEAADVNDDGAVTLGDATSLISRVFGSLFLPAPGARLCGLDPRDGLDDGALGCASYTACDAGALADTPAVRLRFAATVPRPGRPDGTRDVATAVLLDADTAVHGWSLAVRSSCPLSSVTTAGTVAAPASLDPAGRIASDGFHTFRLEPDARGVVSAAALSSSDAALSLEAGATHTLLRLAVETTTLFGGCETCELAFDDDFLPRFTNAVMVPEGAFRPVTAASMINTCCLAQPLDYGLELRALLTIDSPSLCVRLPPPLASARTQAVRIAVSALGSENVGITTYARWGETGPTAVAFDGAAKERYRSNQVLILPAARPEPLGLLVVGDVLPVDNFGTEIAVRVDLVAAGLESITPTASAPTLIHAVVTGGRFAADMSFALIGPDGVDRLAVNVFVRWLDEAVMDFDLNGALLGDYDLVLRRGGLELDRLPNAYRVNPRRTGGLFVIDLDVPRLYRNAELARLIVRYGNAGDEPMVSPLIQLNGPTGVFFSLTSADLQADRLQLLAVAADGSGALAPGALVEVPVYFQIRVDSSVGTILAFSASSLRSDTMATITWSALPWLGSLPAPDRPLLVAGLERRFGATWIDYALGLARLSSTLALRGEPTNSVAQVFDFAARQAVLQPLGGITGQVLSVDGVPVDGVVVAALRGGLTSAVAQSVGEGKFTLNWLAPGTSYDLAVDGYKLLLPVLAAARGLDDPPELVLATTDLSTNPSSYACPACEPPALPGAPPAIPAAELQGLATATSSVVTSHDPNTKTDDEAPGEGDPFGAVQPGELLIYRINFENERIGSAPAKKVIISDRLDPRLDPASFCFLDAGFGCHRFALDSSDDASCPGTAPPGPYGSYAGQPTLPITCGYQVVREVPTVVDGRNYCARVRGELVEEASGWCAVWRFETFLPGCTTLASGTLDGFLPPDDCPEPDVPGDSCVGPDLTHDSEGFVSFAVRARGDLQVEDDITNEALIKFDNLDPLRTVPPVVKPVSLTPERPTGPIPSDGAQNVPTTQPLLWQPAEYAIAYEIFLWKAGEPKPATGAAVVPVGFFAPPGGLSPGTNYRWQVVAGRGPRRAPGAEWSFRTAGGTGSGPRFVRGDSDSNSVIELTDMVVITDFLFLGKGPPKCMEAAEANHDGTLDLSDVVYISGWLFLGRSAPPPPTPSAGDYPAIDCGLDSDATTLGCVTIAVKCR